MMVLKISIAMLLCGLVAFSNAYPPKMGYDARKLQAAERYSPEADSAYMNGYLSESQGASMDGYAPKPQAASMDRYPPKAKSASMDRYPPKAKSAYMDRYLPKPLPDAARMEAIPISDFFAFGFNEGDSSLPPNDDGSSGQISVSPFPFYARTITSLWVNTNGVVSFDAAVPQFTPDSFPITGSALFSPYWADVDIRGTGQIYYRESSDQNLLNKATTDIISIFPEFSGSFSASRLFIATWDRVGYFNSNTDLTNTFQCIIISDGTHTFVTFLYNDIQWTTGDASGGTGGFGGTPAQVGFNAGDGTFFSLQGSQTAAIVDIESTTNVGVPGQYTFRVDEAEIVSPLVCPCLSAPTHGQIDVTGHSVGSQAIYDCGHVDQQTFQPITHTRHCIVDPNDPTQAIWSDQALICPISVCDYPDPMANGYVTVTTLNVGSGVTYVCYEGYVMSGLPNTRNCVHTPGTNTGAHWDHAVPTCTAVPHLACSMPSPPFHGRVTVTGFELGSVATFNCDDGYAINGSPAINCVKDPYDETQAVWFTGTQPSCQAITACEDQMQTQAQGIQNKAGKGANKGYYAEQDIIEEMRHTMASQQQHN